MNLEFCLDAPVFHAEELNEIERAADSLAIRRAKNYLVSEAELLESIIEIDQLRIFEKFGFSYLTTYCVKHLRLDESVAGVLVRVARKSQAVPELKLAVVAGEVSISNARTISSVINRDNQAEWIAKAKTLPKQKLEREVAIISPSKAKPEKVRHIGNGRVQIVVNLSEEEFGQRSRVKDLVSQSLSKTATDAEVEAAMMNCYLFHKDPVQKAERAAKQKSKETDASRDVSVSRGGSVPAHVEHAVNLRDRGACQGRLADGTICGSTRWTHLHHIVPKAQGGRDVPENLVTLCAAHHRLWHKRQDSSFSMAKLIPVQFFL